MANERADGLDMRYVHPVRHTFFPQSASIPGRAARRLHAYNIRCLRLLIRMTQVLCWSAVDEIPPPPPVPTRARMHSCNIDAIRPSFIDPTVCAYPCHCDVKNIGASGVPPTPYEELKALPCQCMYVAHTELVIRSEIAAGEA